LNKSTYGWVRWRTYFTNAIGSRLGANILSLYVAQGLNYLLPLLVLPYLLRVLGPGSYGSIAFAQAFIAYVVILTDFGFHFSATRAVSLARDDAGQLARIFWSTMAAKSLLLVLGALVVVPAILLVPALREHWTLIALCSLVVVGGVILPQWYFQGLERMRAFAAVQVVVKLITLPAIFVFVHSAADELPAAAILSLPTMMAGIICLCTMRIIAPVRFYRPMPADIRAALTSSWHFFVSNAATSMYVSSNAFILGLLSGDYAVGLYSLANKVTLAVFNLLSPIVQATFPRASLLFSRSAKEAKAFVGRLSLLLLPTSALLSAAVVIFAPAIVNLLAGDQYADAVPVLRVMGLLPLILTGATVLAQIIMMNLGLARALSRVYIVVGVLSLILVPVMASRYGALGAAVSLVVVEALGAALMIRAVCRARFFDAA
jgi:O-antigen/teichoic acid export membrane protein